MVKCFVVKERSQFDGGFLGLRGCGLCTGGAPPTPPGTSRSATNSFMDSSQSVFNLNISQIGRNAESNFTPRHDLLISWIWPQCSTDISIEELYGVE